MTEARKSGVVARIERLKGYGFITCGADGRDYFFHCTQLVNVGLPELQLGDDVTFTLGDYKGKPQCEEVRRVYAGDDEALR